MHHLEFRCPVCSSSLSLENECIYIKYICISEWPHRPSDSRGACSFRNENLKMSKKACRFSPNWVELGEVGQGVEHYGSTVPFTRYLCDDGESPRIPAYFLPHRQIVPFDGRMAFTFIIDFV